MTATESSVSALRSGSGRCARHLTPSNALADYWALTKPEVNFLIVITTLAGFCLGLAQPRLIRSPSLAAYSYLARDVVGGRGTGTLNQYIERRFDAQMRRTARRPLAAGRIEPSGALWFGILLSCVGGIYLAVAVNALASLLAVLTLVSYLFLYTPLKRKTPSLHAGWCFSWRCASANRMGGRVRQVEHGGLGALCHPFPLAIPSLYGDCLDVSGGLRSGRLPGSSFGGAKRFFHGLAKPLAASCLASPQSGSNDTGPCRFNLPGRSFAAELQLSLFWSTPGLEPIECYRPSAPFASIIYLPLVFVLMVLDKA